MKYSVIVPCYNTQEIFDQELACIYAVFHNRLHTDSFEVILVNDCSPNPETLPFLQEMRRKYPFVKLIDLVKNTGQANAQLAAMHFVTGEIVVNLDDDMQTRPDNIPVLLEKLEEGYDVVFGRYFHKKHNAIRRLFTRMDDSFETVFLNKPKNLSCTSFWVARRYVINEIINYKYAYSFMEGLFLRTTRRMTNVDIEHYDRVEGKSGYTFRSLLKLWSNFTNFTVKPLRIAGVVGILTVLFAFIFLLVTIFRRIADPTIPPGYSALMCVMLFFFGMVMMMLGIMGEYIGRIFMCINSSPQFVVKKIYEKTGNGPEEEEACDAEKTADTGNTL